MPRRQLESHKDSDPFLSSQPHRRQGERKQPQATEGSNIATPDDIVSKSKRTTRRAKEKVIPGSHTNVATSLSYTNGVYPLPEILVPDSADEGDTKGILGGQWENRRAAKDTIVLQCVGQIDDGAVHLIQKLSKVKGPVEISMEIPASEDEDIQYTLEDTPHPASYHFNTPTKEINEPGVPTSQKDANPILEEQCHLSHLAQSVPAVDDSLDVLVLSDGTQGHGDISHVTLTTTPENTSEHWRENGNATDQQGTRKDSQSDPIVVNYEIPKEVLPFVGAVRSYPLRARTFQQQKPYTADKQQHARLIRGGAAPERFHAGKYSKNDDEGDSEYEEEDHLLAPSVTQTLDIRQDGSIDAKIAFDAAHGDLFSQDFDNERLQESDAENVQQKRKRSLMKPAERGLPQALSKVRLHPKLNSKTKRKLERLVGQTIEPLEPIDAIPMETRYPQHGQNAIFVLDGGYGGLNEQHQSALTSEGQDSNSEPDRPFSDQSDIASRNEPKTKKARRHRQHVLPAAFFKKNLLPDDASTLRSLRSKVGTSRKGLGGSLEELPGTDRLQHAHHAKTRLVTSQQGGDALNSFMAQLAQDGDVSDEESQDVMDEYETSPSPGPARSARRAPSYPRESLIDRLIVRASNRKSTRPVLSDTEASEDYTSRAAKANYLPRRPRSKARKSEWAAQNQPLEYFTPHADYSGASSDSSEAYEDTRKDGNMGTAKKRRWTAGHNSSTLPSNFNETEEVDDFLDAEDHYESLDLRQPRQHVNHNNLVSNHRARATNTVARDTRSRSRKNRPVYRSRVIPIRRRNPRQWMPRNTAQQKLGGASLGVQNQTKPVSNPRSITIQSQLTAWNQSMSRPSHPQLVNKPVFIPQPRAKKVHRHADTSLKPPFAQASHSDSEDGNSLDVIPEQPWEDFQNEPQLDPTTISPELLRSTIPKQPLPMHKSNLINNHPKSPINNDSYLQAGTTIPNGLYFSRDTYIGQGILSLVLRTMTVEGVDIPAPTRLTSNIVLFDRLLQLESMDPSSIKRELEGVTVEFTKRLPTIDLGLRTACTLDQLREAKRCRNECLHALEGLTRLVAKLMVDWSQEQLSEFWETFMSDVVCSLAKITESLRDSKYPSLKWSLNMWIQWATVAWNTMIHTRLGNETLSLHKAAESLMELLIVASDNHLLQQVTQVEEVARRSQGAIYDQELIEVWVCFTRVFDKLSQGQWPPSFWNLFNDQISSYHAKVVGNGDRGHEGVYEDRFGHYLSLMTCLCRLHQFETDGSSNRAIHAPENWGLVLWALQNGWLSGLSPDQFTDERQLKWFLTFIHNRIQLWNWEPNVDILSYIFKFFAGRDFRDMPTEPGYRLPEFLKRMITETATHGSKPANNGESTTLSRSGFIPDMTYVETLETHDRCFEISLKILAVTLRYQVDRIYQGDCFSGLDSPTPYAAPQSIRLATPNLALPFHVLSKLEQIKICKRLLSSLSPVLVATISSNSVDRSYSSLCNPCNLVLLIALLVPDSIRPSTVGQLRSLLNFDESDDASRRILLESVYYLGLIWQSQRGHQEMVALQGRPLESILDYLFDRLSYLGSLVEANAKSSGDDASYIRRKDRQSPVSSLIETVLNHIHRLLLNDVKTASDASGRYPPIPFMDERLGRFLSMGVPYPSETRLHALAIVESFMVIRKQCLSDPGMETIGTSDKLQAEASPTVNQHQNNTCPKDAADDGFSSLEFDEFVFDENDFADLSQLSEGTFPEEKDQGLASSEISARVSNTPCTMPQDIILVDVLQAWVYPKLEALINERQQTAHEEQQKQALSTIPGGFAQSSSGLKTSMVQGRLMIEPFSRNKVAFSDSMSQHGIQRIINAFADCCLVILQQGKGTFAQISSLFKRETWHSPWLQHYRLLDELQWATHLAVSSPWIIHEQEDWFLNIWFSTISIPLHEITVQHRLLLSFLRLFTPKARFDRGVCLSNESRFGRSMQQHSENSLFEHLFNDLPIAHQDHSTFVESANVLSRPNELIGQTLQDTEKDSRLLHEFKEARLQILARVLSNIGDHYLKVRPATGSANHKSHLLKSQYQNYLGILLNQIKKDYERLNARQMVRENLQHVKLAHHVVGHVIQNCGILLQGSQLTGTQHSILNYLTSSRMFPQPQLDGVYVHQKIRGYAYLYHAGERHFFHDLLDTVMSHLRHVRGMDDFQSTLRLKDDEITNPSIKNPHELMSLGKDNDAPGISVSIMDRGIVVYRHPPLPTDNDMAVNGSKTLIQGKDTPIHSTVTASHTVLNPPTLMGHRATTKPSIQTLVASQHLKNLKRNDQDSLWVLTSSLRNSALETEDKKQWNHVLSSFRTMAFVSILGPLLTSFLDVGSNGRGVNPSVTGFTGNSSTTVGHRFHLIDLAVPATRWLSSLIDALTTELSLMTDPTKKTSNTLSTSNVLVAYDQFQKETSTLFYPLIRCLSGSYEIAHSSWLDKMRECLCHSQSRDTPNISGMETPSEEDKGAARALYMFGQALHVIEALCRTTRKIQTEQTKFYTQNSAWRDAYLELAQFAVDHGFLLLRRLGNRPSGGAIVMDQDTLLVDSERQSARDRVGDAFMLEHASLEDRISGATDVVSLESSFSEFLSGQGHLQSLTEIVRSHIQALSPAKESPQMPGASTWLDDLFAPEGSQNTLGESSLVRSLAKQHRAVLSFLVSFLKFIRTVSTLDARFHRQVLHLLSTLLLPENDRSQNMSLWLELSEKTTGIQPPSALSTSQAKLHWCLGQEWCRFLSDFCPSTPVCTTGSLGQSYGDIFV